MTAPILIMAGGTGGHVFPALAVARMLRGQDQEIVWLGTRRGIEADLVPREGIPLEAIMTELFYSGEVERNYRLLREVGFTLAGEIGDETVAKLVGLANQRGGRDNITVLAVHIESTAAPAARVRRLEQRAS